MGVGSPVCGIGHDPDSSALGGFHLRAEPCHLSPPSMSVVCHVLIVMITHLHYDVSETQRVQSVWWLLSQDDFWMPTESGSLGPTPRAPVASLAWRGGVLGVNLGGGQACGRTGSSTQPSSLRLWVASLREPLALAGPQVPPPSPSAGGTAPAFPCLDLSPKSLAVTDAEGVNVNDGGQGWGRGSTQFRTF